jgi:D-methionine transport system substrate-binding protein
MKKILSLLTVFLLLIFVAGCSNSNGAQEPATENKKVDIVIACAETTQALVDAVVPVMKEKGYNVTYQMFDNNVNTMVATNDESVDALFVVHKPFMENFNNANKADLVMLEPHVFSVGMGLFSEKYEKVEDLPNGASISIMNDAMNMDRALRIFSDAGLIKIKAGIDKVTLLDIEENPKNFKFTEMDQTQTVRSLQDMDAVVAFFSHMKNANKDFKAYLIRDQHPEYYPQGVVVKAKNSDAQWAKDLVESFRSDKVRTFANDHYGGLYEYIE